MSESDGLTQGRKAADPQQLGQQTHMITNCRTSEQLWLRRGITKATGGMEIPNGTRAVQKDLQLVHLLIPS